MDIRLTNPQSPYTYNHHNYQTTYDDRNFFDPHRTHRVDDRIDNDGPTKRSKVVNGTTGSAEDTLESYISNSYGNNSHNNGGISNLSQSFGDYAGLGSSIEGFSILGSSFDFSNYSQNETENHPHDSDDSTPDPSVGPNDANGNHDYTDCIGLTERSGYCGQSPNSGIVQENNPRPPTPSNDSFTSLTNNNSTDDDQYFNHNEVCEHNDCNFNEGHRTCTDCGVVPFGMQLAQGPPANFVYKRNIRADGDENSYPLIHIGANPDDPKDWSQIIETFTVKVKIVNEGTFDEFVGEILSGPTTYNYSYKDVEVGVNVLFKKLQVSVTSNQPKNLKNKDEETVSNNNFLLQWDFYANKKGHDSESFLLATVRSNPFRVHSHSKQIKEAYCKTDPTVSRVIPAQVDMSRVTEVAIFGSNFISKKTKVKLAGCSVGVDCHNRGAGSFQINDEMLSRIRSQNNIKNEIPVFISNDGESWIDTAVRISFINEDLLAEQLLLENFNM